MPSFLPSVPLTNPRTLCACQPVALIISARDAPLGRLIRSRTLAPLLSARRVPDSFVLAGLAALGAFFEAGASFFAAAGLAGLLAVFLALGAGFFLLASFFEEGFAGAPFAPCSA